MSDVLRTIILASASPRRLDLLRSLGLEVVVNVSDYAEAPDASASPLELAERHARAKSLTVAMRFPATTSPIVGADTIVDLDGNALGKPVDRADAARMLRLLSGRTHIVHTAVALVLPGVAAPIDFSSSTRVRFFPLKDDEIAEYVATGEPLDKAGGYGIQGRAAALVEAVEGDFYTVIGFPLARFIRALRELGFSMPTAK